MLLFMMWSYKTQGASWVCYSHWHQVFKKSDIWSTHASFPQFKTLAMLCHPSLFLSPHHHHPLSHPVLESCQQSLHLLPFLWNIYDSWCLNQELASLFRVIMWETEPMTISEGGVGGVFTCARSHTFTFICTQTHANTGSHIKWKWAKL